MENLQAFFGPASVKGTLRAFIVQPGEDVQSKDNKWGCNMLQFSGADVFAKLLSGDTKYAPSGMYLQFTNKVESWTNPSVGRDGALEYFRGLSGDNDYLRVPFMSPAAISSSNDGVFSGNVVDFFAMSAGAVGSRPNSPIEFSNGSSSYIVGGAVIATPDWDDPTKDVILTRGYLTSAIAKPSAGEVVLQWKITCG